MIFQVLDGRCKRGLNGGKEKAFTGQILTRFFYSVWTKNVLNLESYIGKNIDLIIILKSYFLQNIFFTKSLIEPINFCMILLNQFQLKIRRSLLTCSQLQIALRRALP